MNDETYYRDHWLDIDPERIEAYQEMFRWRPEMAALLAPAEIEPGQTIVDYGCGPGQLSLELARRVGEQGHVHGVDINQTFIERSNANAAAERLSDRVTFRCIETSELPFDDASIDRIICKNVLEYVDDIGETFSEFRRTLKPGGRVHAIDSDWGMLVVEPIGAERLAEIFSAASIAYKTPLVGRLLYGLMRAAGFRDVQVKMVAGPDTKGHAAPILFNMAQYARHSGRIEETIVAAFIDDVRAAIDAETFLLVLPQFLVTGIA